MKRIVAIALALAGLGAASAQASPHGAPAASALRVELPTTSPATARAYWTPERMERAIPMKPASPSRPLTPAEPQGEAGRVPATVPSDAQAQSPKLAGDALQLRSELRSYERPGSYTSFPNSTNAKVFFHNPKDGYDYVCSATALTSDNHSVAWTAGHCVVNPGGRYYTNWIVVPAYKDGSAPLGVWTALELWSHEGWARYGDYSYDFAAVVVSPNAAGDRLTDVAGGRGFAWNLARSQDYEAIGYPAMSPFNGERMIACMSSLYGRGLLGENSIGITCDMTPGASGGGWLVQGGYLNSNTSYGYEGLPGVLYGPYLGDAAAELYDAASESTAPGPDPDPDPDPDPVWHETSVTLALKKALVAKGRVSVLDAYPLCANNAFVRIERKDSSGWQKVGKSRADGDGRYSVKIDDRKGRYRTVVPEDGVDDLNLCGASTSSTVRR